LLLVSFVYFHLIKAKFKMNFSQAIHQRKVGIATIIELTSIKFCFQRFQLGWLPE